MANVVNRVEPAVRLALEVRPHERHPERLFCHTRISKKGDVLYKACLSIWAKRKEKLTPNPYSS